MTQTTKMTADREFAEMIIQRLEAGTTPWQRGWSINEALAKPFHNCVSGGEYHGANIFRLFFATEIKGYTDNRWMTYKQAQEKGWQVRKGEKGVHVSFYKAYKPDGTDDEDEDSTVSRIRYAVKVYTVFNASQVDGVPAMPEPDTYEWNPVEIGERILANSGAVIEHKTTANGCSYIPSADIIELPPKEQFIDAAEYYAAALHELAHWTGAAKRLDRGLTTNHGKEEYAREELRAEIASWMISAATGLPFKPDNHAAYVNGWIQAIKRDYREIFRACADAERIKDYILGFMPKSEEKTA